MGQVIPFRRRATPRDLELARQLARESPAEVISFQAVDGSVCVNVAGAELWLSIDEAAELLEILSETLFDAISQIEGL